jgi:thiol-disulfide isomerase/thioredoxin
MSGVIAYHFWSPTCGPCQVIKPAIEDLKEEFPNVLWRSVNTHNDINNASQTFQVSVVPTIVVTKDGSEVGRHSGTSMSIYYSILRKAVAS